MGCELYLNKFAIKIPIKNKIQTTVKINESKSKFLKKINRIIS